MNDHPRGAESSPTPGPGPKPGHADGVDLAALRDRVDDLLDQAQTGGRLTTIQVPVTAEPDATEAGASDESAEGSPDAAGDAAEEAPPEERLLEVTDEQVEALSSAHDELAQALAALDTKR